MSKRILAIALVLITLVSTFTIAANAASYATGTYSVTAAAGVNVRTGAGTSYSRVGAAAYGTTFNVTKISGSWGYTSSIKCTNGTRSGWISLNNCKYINTSRSTYNDVFASTKGSGYSLNQAKPTQSTSFTRGTFIYVWGYVHDANDNLYFSYASGKTCNMTLSIFRPDGSCAYTHTYKNSDNNWIGQRLDQAGTWKIQSKITGSISGTNTRSITVTEPTTTTYCTVTYNANGGSNAPSSQRVAAGTAFYLSSSKPTRSGYTFLGWSTNKNASSASYTPSQKVKTSGSVTLYAIWKKNVVLPTGVSLNYSSCTLNVGSTKQLSATVSPSNANDKTVTWTSSNTNIVSVSSGGKLTAHKPGTATITAKTSNGKTKTCKVTVKGINLSCFDLMASSLYVGDVVTISATAYPSDTTKFQWSSSNSKVLSINSSGKITAKAAGTATITAKTSDGRTARWTITVYQGKTSQRGSFTGYNTGTYTTVRLNQNTGDAKIKIQTYDLIGWKSSGEVHVVLRDWSGKWICEFDAKSGDTLNLGNDHSEYRVYISYKRYPNTVFGNADDFINVGECVTWEIQCTKNCYI